MDVYGYLYNFSMTMADKINIKSDIVAEGATVVVKNVMRPSGLGEPEAPDKMLRLWEMATGRKAEECAHEVCHRPATHAAIAVRAFSSDKTRYMYPACETCARRTEMLYVEGPLLALGENEYAY